ncbi:MAG TPA: HD domain-containing phosphohydrolase [Herpetosiphonaceae bacterium]
MSQEPADPASILLIDDQVMNTQVLTQILRAGGFQQITVTNDSREALALFLRIQPDLVMIDLMMPYVDGFAVIQQLRAQMPPETYVPIMVLTADVSVTAKRRALAMGVQDFLTKPLDSIETLLRVRNTLQLYRLHQTVQLQNQMLNQRVRERTAAMEHARAEALLRLARTAEFRDDETGMHAQRVGVLAKHLAEALGLPPDEVSCLHQAAPLHDIGKIGIPDAILRKEGPLTPEERSLMERHTTIGARILEQSKVPVFQLGEVIARSHHERWDGAGYPDRLAGEAIPLASRIVAVADTFDVMTHDRPYRTRQTVAAAIAEIQAHSGAQFDPAVVDALVGLWRSRVSLEDELQLALPV